MHKPIHIPSALTFKFAWIFFLLALISNVQAQQVNLDSIASRFENFNANNLQEKIFVHTDREMYLAGEIIWFKLYYTSGTTNELLDLSKIAYVEVIDKNQKPVLQAKISIEKGIGNGSLYLPVSLTSGNYQFRAYTNWMKNFSPDYFFNKNISIVNSLLKPENLQSDKAAATRYDVQFFPEGGQIIENLPGKVAFRAIDNQGKGVNFNGTLVDQNNAVLLRFKPLKFGIGSFSFIPEAGKTYRALIELPGENISREIPIAKTGYVIQLSDNQNDKLKLSLQTNGISANQKVHLFVHTRQVTNMKVSADLDMGKAEFLIDKSKLGEGISHLTVFNGLGQAVAERLFFKKPSSKLLINTNTDQQKYAPRKKVTINLDAKDEKGQALAVDASVSVYATDSLEADNGDIFNYLWLKSDLKGNVESPAYYFNTNDAISKEALDNLMLTHGWRRFVWQDLLKNTIPSVEFLPEIDGHIINGRILDTRTNAPAIGIMTYLAVPGKKLHIYGSKSNNTGQVRFYTRDIFGPSELVVQTKYQQDSTYRIDISNPFLEKYSSSVPYDLNLSEKFKSSILNQSVSSQVQTIFAGDKLKTFYPALTDSTAFYIKSDKTYLLDNFVRFNTMEEVLREYVTEVPLMRQKDDFTILVRVKPHPNNFPRNVEPLILLDGVPVFDRGNKIIKYDPKKVRELEVVAKRYFLGPLMFNSILNFKTYKGNLPDFQLDPRATVMDYEGMQLKREFYSPLYETEAKVSERLPDFRNVLYWSPDLKIDSNGKKTISFYTSDQENKYTVVVQGISPEGKLGSSKIEILVKK
jgi:hypothetical protein|uniref:hypothetical protein n=1 Tax=Daejeonella sp. TaxID=2805397 RepID=UPI004049A2B0